MAKSQELKNQLKTQQQINQVLQQRSTLLQNQQTSLQGQVQMAAELCKALECKQLEGMQDRINDIRDSMDEAAESATTMGKQMENSAQGLGAKSSEAAKGTRKVKKELTAGQVAAVGFFSGLVSGFQTAVAQMQALGSLTGSVMKGFFSIGKSILSIPFKMLDGLIGMLGGGGGPNPIKVAMEEIRKEFGTFATGEANALYHASKKIRKEFRAHAGTGLQLRRIYGRGREGVAAAMKDALEMAQAFGQQFKFVMAEFKKSMPDLLRFKKGLGLTAEGFANLGKLAYHSGKSMKSMLTDLTKHTQHMAKAFNMSAKVLARAVSEMAGQIEHFTHLGIEGMSELATYANRLGIETKALSGIMDKFMNFEDAIESVSKLNAVMGWNLNAMEQFKLMAKDPAKGIEKMRGEFFKMGKNFNELLPQQKKYIMQQTGMDAATAQAAFSMKNQGKSLKEVQEEQEKAKKKQLTTAQALDKLAKSIERVFGGGGGQMKSFWDQFVKGFTKGIRRTREFRKLMRNLKRSLRETYKFGKRFGKMFMDTFPGFKDMVKGLADMFDPAKFRALFKDLLGVFRKFFTAVKTDPKAGVETLLEDLKGIFGKFFDKESGPAGEFLKGLETFLGTIARIIIAAIPIAARAMAEAINKVADVIRDPTAFLAMGDAATQGIRGVFIEAFMALYQAAGIIGEALLNLLKAVWEKHGDKIMKFFGFVWKAIMIKSLVTGVLAALKGVVFFMLAKKVAAHFAAVAATAAAGAGAKGATGAILGATGSVGASQGMMATLGTMTTGSIAASALKLNILAAAFIPAVIMFASGIAAAAMILMTVGIKGIITAMLGLGTAIAAIAGFVKLHVLIGRKSVVLMGVRLRQLAMFMLTGVLPFAAAMTLVAVVMSAVNPVGMILAMGAVAAGFAAAAYMGTQAQFLAGIPWPVALKGVAMAALFTVTGVLLFALALMALYAVTSSMDGDAMMKIMMAMAVGAIAIGMVALSVLVAGYAAAAAVGAIPMFIGFTLLAIGLGIALVLLGNVLPAASEMGKMALGYLAMAAMVGAIALIALAIGNPAVMTAMLMGMAGIVIAAVFTGLLYLFITKGLVPAWKGIQEMGGVPAIVGMAIAMVAMNILMLALYGVAMFATVGMAFFILGMVGLWLASSFVDVLNGSFMTSIQEFDTKTDELGDPKKLGMKAEALGTVMSSFAIMAAAAWSLGMTSFSLWSLIGDSPMEKGFKSIGMISQLMGQHLFPAIAKILAAPVKSSKTVKAKTEMIVAAMDGISKLGCIGVAFADIEVGWFEGTVSTVEGVVKAVMPLIDLIVGSVTKPGGLIDKLVEMVKGFKKSDVKKAEAAGKLMGSMGDLLLALQPPTSLIEAAQADADWDMFEDTSDALMDMMKPLTCYVNKMIDIIITKAEPMIKALINVRLPRVTRALERKVKVIGEIITAVSKFGSMLGSFMQIAQQYSPEERGHGFLWLEKRKNFEKGFQRVEAMAGVIMRILTTNFPTIIENVRKVAVTMEGGRKLESQIKMVAMSIDIIVKFSNMITDVMEKAKDLSGGVMERALSYGEGKSPLDIMMQSAKQIVTMLTDSKGGIKPIIKAVRDVAEGISSPKKLREQMEVVALALKIVVDFGKMVNDMWKLAKESGAEFIANISKGGESPGVAMLNNLSKMATAIVEIMDENLDKLFTTVSRVANRVTDVKGMKKKFEVLAQMMGVVGSFASMVRDVAGLMPTGDIAEDMDLPQRIQAMKDTVWGVVAAMVGDESQGTEIGRGRRKYTQGKGGLGHLAQIIKQASRHTIPLGRAKALTQMFCAIMVLADAIKTIGSMDSMRQENESAAGRETLGEMMRRNIGAIVEAFTPGESGKSIKDLIVAVKASGLGGNPRQLVNAGKGMEGLATVFDSLKSIMTAAKGLDEYVGDDGKFVFGDVFTAIKGFFSSDRNDVNSVGSLIQSIVTSGVAKMTPFFRKVGESMDLLQDAMTKMVNVSRGGAALDFAAGFGAFAGNIAIGFANLDKAYEAIVEGKPWVYGSNGIWNLTRESRSTVSTRKKVQEIVSHINEVRAGLSNLPDMNLNAVVEKLADMTAITTDTLQINNTPININITANISMKASQIANSLTDKSNNNTWRLAKAVPT